MARKAIYKPGNAGVVVVTGGGVNDLLHTLSLGRSVIITKICCYNNTGANALLQFGTLDRNPAGAAFVVLLPVLVAINGLDNEWNEAELPGVEFLSWPQVTVAGRTGDIYVNVAAALTPTVQIEVKEIGG